LKQIKGYGDSSRQIELRRRRSRASTVRGTVAPMMPCRRTKHVDCRSSQRRMEEAKAVGSDAKDSQPTATIPLLWLRDTSECATEVDRPGAAVHAAKISIAELSANSSPPRQPL